MGWLNCIICKTLNVTEQTMLFDHWPSIQNIRISNYKVLVTSPTTIIDFYYNFSQKKLLFASFTYLKFNWKYLLTPICVIFIFNTITKYLNTNRFTNTPHLNKQKMANWCDDKNCVFVIVTRTDHKALLCRLTGTVGRNIFTSALKL